MGQRMRITRRTREMEEAGRWGGGAERVATEEATMKKLVSITECANNEISVPDGGCKKWYPRVC